ncbi:MAG: FAD-binding protein, partial [Planctomycetota bacterium]
MNSELPTDDLSLLAFGQGRSYGDVCLNNDQCLLLTRRLRAIELDSNRSTLSCEAGATLDEILRTIVPDGFFLPVTPGTKAVTVGGAIANDVHGKNHRDAGSFGHHVRSFVLLRSSGERLTCSRDENSELFRATIGGLGLTGLILSAEIDLLPISSPRIVGTVERVSAIDELLERAASSSA